MPPSGSAGRPASGSAALPGYSGRTRTRRSAYDPSSTDRSPTGPSRSTTTDPVVVSGQRADPSSRSSVIVTATSLSLTRGVASLSSGQLSQGTQYPLKLAAAALMTIPVAVVFFLFQKRIMNTSEGAVKG